MSTPWTNRMKSDRSRSPRDFYSTPQSLANSATYGLFSEYSFPIGSGGFRVIDPGCGTGVWGRSVSLVSPSSHIIGVDVERPNTDDLSEYSEFYQEDYTHIIQWKNGYNSETKLNWLDWGYDEASLASRLK